VLDYPQQILSVQPAYFRMLGQWPHHARYKGEILSSLAVKPVDGSDDQSTWSVIHFLSQENRRSGTGVRGDVIAFDEPPRIEILRELRKASHAGRRSVMLIGETPTIRSQWAPLKADYGDPPRMSLTRIDRDRAEVRWSLDEVAEWVLSREEKEKLQRRYWGPADRDKPMDPLYDARMHGDYIDTSGDCPFDIDALRRMLAECGDTETCEWNITREVEGEDGLRRKVVRVAVSVIEHAKIGSKYYVNVDPSAGIASGNHDPGAILVSEMGTGRDVAMFEGYLGPYGLGVLAATLAKQYHGAVIDPENNSGWGLSVMRGIADCGYNNVASERKPFGTNGEFRNVLGFSTTTQSRPGMIGAVKEWVDAYAAGAPYAKCGFRRVIETLIDVILDEDDRPSAAPGFHDEFLILKGQSLLKTRPRRHDPLLARPLVKPVSRREPTLEEMLASVEKPNGFGGRMNPRRPQLRPIHR
jgi:hypothetical protein